MCTPGIWEAANKGSRLAEAGSEQGGRGRGRGAGDAATIKNPFITVHATPLAPPTPGPSFHPGRKRKEVRGPRPETRKLSLLRIR